MVINHNMSAMFATRAEGLTEVSQQKDMEKLSSGMRINRAGDDASGLAVSEKMRSQIRGLNQASTNAQNGISFIQTTEGYLQETTDIIQRIRELAVQSSNGIYSAEDRMQIQVEVSSLIAEVDRIASAAPRWPAPRRTPSLPAATCRSTDIADIAVNHHFPLLFQDEKPYSNLHVSTTTPIRA